MCLSGATCLSADCCFSELALKKATKRVGLVQSRSHHHLIKKKNCSCHDIAENC